MKLVSFTAPDHSQVYIAVDMVCAVAPSVGAAANANACIWHQSGQLHVCESVIDVVTRLQMAAAGVR